MYCRISKYTRGKKPPFHPQKYFWNQKVCVIVNISSKSPKSVTGCWGRLCGESRGPKRRQNWN